MREEERERRERERKRERERYQLIPNPRQNAEVIF
jgi:hypothetical protein